MPDPSSGASERRGYTLRSLPNTEYKGRPPKFPLPPYVLRYFDKDSQEWVEDRAGSESWNERESELWRQLWRLPQARAWKQPAAEVSALPDRLVCPRMRGVRESVGQGG